MQFHFGATVEQPDGGKLGELRRIVYDPDTWEIVSLVVTENRVDGRDVLVPVGVIQSSDDDAVILSIAEDQFDGFEPFVIDRNVAPPPRAENVGSDSVREPNVPDVLPIGAATGIESIAYTPVIDEFVLSPAGDGTITGSTVVWATEGELGRVAEIWTDDQTKRLASVIVEKGLLFKQRVEVPADAIEALRSEVIVLSAPAERFEPDEN